MRHLSFDKGAVIFREGSYDETMYEICAGQVDIIAGYESDNETLLATLGEGQTFGEMGLVEFWSRSATAVAAQDATEVEEIGFDEYMTYLKDQPDKVLSIMRQLSARLRTTDAKYQEACRTVFEAVEAEREGKRRSSGLRARLSDLVRQLTSSTGRGVMFRVL